jgi:hypothetical protein
MGSFSMDHHTAFVLVRYHACDAADGLGQRVASDSCSWQEATRSSWNRWCASAQWECTAQLQMCIRQCPGVWRVQRNMLCLSGRCSHILISCCFSTSYVSGVAAPTPPPTAAAADAGAEQSEQSVASGRCMLLTSIPPAGSK